MSPLHIFGLNWPIGIDDTTAWRWGNRPSQYEAWQFGLIEIRAAELARRFFSHLQQARRNGRSAAVAMRLAPKCLTRQ
jgi:hypothetical protein